MLPPFPLFLCLLTLCFSVLSSHPLFLCVLTLCFSVLFSHPFCCLCYLLTLCFSVLSPHPLSLSELHYVHVVHGWMSTVLLTFDCWQHFFGSCWRCLKCALVTALGLRVDWVVFIQLRLSLFLTLALWLTSVFTLLALLADKCVHASCTVDCSWYVSHWML